MNNHEYFELYHLILKTIEEKRPANMNKLIKELNQTDFIIERLDNNNKTLISYTFEVTDNLLNDNLIKGTKTFSKDGNIYEFNGLSTQGYRYLESLEDKDLKNKAIKYLKENGLSPTPESITKAIANMFW